MKDLLKHTIACRIAGCLAAFCLTFVSCTSTVDDGLQDSRAITFTPAADTRAAVTGFKDMGDFQVWGWYGGDGTAAPNNVFDGTVVYKDAGWNYTDGVRYWKAGETYNFYAVYPTDVKANVSSEGTITVTDFDCSKTGTEAVDLMTATATGVVADNMIKGGGKVDLTFQHALARVNIIVTSKGDAVNISDARLYGISHKGSLNGNEWDFGEISDVNAPSFETESLSIPANDTKDYFLFGGDLLLPPHKSLSDNAALSFSYQYTTGDTTSKSASIKLKTSSVTTWEKGKRYNYRINISRNATNVTLVVEVTNWIEKNYTVEW